MFIHSIILTRLALFIACFLFWLNSLSLLAQDTIYTRTVAFELDHVWEIVYGQDGNLWVTERRGIISKIDPTSGFKKTVLRLTEVHQFGESGLLGLTLHPDFPNTPYLYTAYTYLDANQSFFQRIVRYSYRADSLFDQFVLLDSIVAQRTHNGCRLLITPDLKLLVTTGDAQNQNISQDTLGLNGRILRLNLDGTIPNDNPFPNNYTFVLGSRNAQGLTISPQGTVYISEHGPANDDEISILKAGANLGWPNVHGYCDEADEIAFCEANNVTEPIQAWSPTIAVCGLQHYHHKMFPKWNNCLLVATLKEQDLRVLKLAPDGQSIDVNDTTVREKILFNEEFGRLRAIAIGPDGRLFIGTTNGRRNDRIIEITGPEPTSVAHQMSNVANAPKVINTWIQDDRLVFNLPADFVLINALGQTITSVNGTASYSTAHLPNGVYTVRASAPHQMNNASINVPTLEHGVATKVLIMRQ
jgi:aldose sugar dehydrogenase